MIRRALRALLTRDIEEGPCDCPACSFGREVEALTPAHVVAAIIEGAESIDDVYARAVAITEAVTFACAEAEVVWRLQDPAVAAEVEALDALYHSPAWGEVAWIEDESTRDDPTE